MIKPEISHNGEMLDVITEIFYEGEWTDFVVEHFLGGRWLEKSKRRTSI